MDDSNEYTKISIQYLHTSVETIEKSTTLTQNIVTKTVYVLTSHLTHFEENDNPSMGLVFGNYEGLETVKVLNNDFTIRYINNNHFINFVKYVYITFEIC
jgi:hypothetical protein